MKSTRTLLLFLVVPVILLLPGCYGKKMLREPVTIEEIAVDVSQIKADQAGLRTGMGDIEKNLEKQAETIRNLQAENQYLWQELDNRLLAIDSKLQDVIGRSSGYSSSGPYWSGSADEPSAEDGDRSPPSPFAYAPRPVDPQSPDGEVTRPESTGGDDPGYPERPEASRGSDGPDFQAKRVYDQAYLDLTRGNYSLAILGFTEFLRRSPGTDLADNAQYWVGECYYAQGDYRQAIREFQKVLGAYPNGDKHAGALLKIGFSSIQLDDLTEAREYLLQVTEKYPNSEESKLARDKLRSFE